MTLPFIKEFLQNLNFVNVEKKKSVLLFIIIKKMILTCGVKLNELQILAWQAGTGYHGITISCTSVC